MTRVFRRLPFAALAACLLPFALSACGDNPQSGGDCDCSVAPAPVCTADGRLTRYVAPTSCEAGECVFTETTATCEFGCADGACRDVPAECDPNPCTQPPAPECDGNVLVQAQVPGTCEEGPTCRYTFVRQDCGEDVCFDGECRPVDCTFITCDEPPAATCDGDVAVQFGGLGSCDDQTLECQYPEQRDDCAARGETCQAGVCVDACVGITCLAPPEAACDGGTAVTYAAVGECDAGVCSYAESRVDCEAAGELCDAGACVPACVDDSCIDPPDDACSEDGRQRIIYETVGACGDDDLCAYDEAARQDCTADGLVCVEGACVPDPLCEGVDCSTPPAPACVGGSAVTYDAGLCVAGACQYAEVSVDCGAAGLLCSEGACVDRCAVDGCVSPPADYCEGDAAVLYGTFGTCDAEEGCSYPTFVDNCASRGLTCADGACVDPSCDCDEAPERGYCDGELRIEYVAPGLCEDEGCVFKEEVAEDCSASGQSCVLGECVPACPDEPCRPPAAACDGDVVVEYDRAGACLEDNTCDFSAGEIRTDCRADGLACVDGACVDACEFLVCDALPDPVCDGDVAVLATFPAACIDSACEYTTQRIDCTTTGDVCFEGACVDPCIGIICDDAPDDECIDEVAVSYRDTGRCEAGECVYGTDDFDCASVGFVCQDASCVDACVGVTCDDVPADGCVDDAVVTYSGDSVCSMGECVYFTSSFLDCTESGRVCESSMCVDPCATVTCDAPPAPRCEGDVAISAAAAGTCDAGVCTYDEVTTDCSELGAACRAGACEDLCTNVECEDISGLFCEGGLAVEYFASPSTCLFGECFYDTSAEDCVALGEGCTDGECAPTGDLCAFIDCTQPDPACDGDVALSYSGDGVCDAGARGCDFSAVEVRTACAGGTTCVAGVCRQAPAYGDVIINEVFLDAAGSDEVLGEWIELYNTTAEPIELTGSILRAPTGATFVFPTATIAAGDAYVVGTTGGVAAVDLTVDFLAFNLPNTGGSISLEVEGTTVDEVVIDGAWPLTTGSAVALDSAQRDADANDDASAWCVATAVYDLGSGSRGTPGSAGADCAP